MKVLVMRARSRSRETELRWRLFASQSHITPSPQPEGLPISMEWKPCSTTINQRHKRIKALASYHDPLLDAMRLQTIRRVLNQKQCPNTPIETNPFPSM